MATDNWLNETLYPNWGQRFLVQRELARVQSAFQDIVIFESVSHGRVMVLDGVIQITESDEFVYQEMLAHVPLLAHGAAESVLIIGAGDGGVLRRVLQHRTVTRAVLVEIDGEVIRLSKEFLPAIGGDAWHDPRAEVIVGDGIDYVRRAPDAGRRAARYQREAVKVLSPCHRVCRCGSDLCRRLHDAWLGFEGCVVDAGRRGRDPGTRACRRHPRQHSLLVA